MSTQYNRFRAGFNTASARASLIDVLFAGRGLPADTVDLGGFAANAFADIEPVSNPLNRVLNSGKKIGHRLRYVHPSAGTNDGVILIHCNGHDATSKSTAYTANSAGSGVTNAQRMQFHGLPTNAHASVTGAAVPLTSGIGVLEVSLLGQYLCWVNGIVGTMANASHTEFVKDLAGQGVGNFLYPMIVAINSVIAAGKKPVIAGFSGGGWMTQLVAAIDPRVRLSFVMSGWPGKLSETAVGASDLGASADGEQIEPEIYHNPATGTSIANMHELAVMGADAPGRAQWNIWSVATTGADTVFPMTADDIAGFQQDGLRGEAAARGGDLRFVGFDGLNDPCANFATGAAATYAAAVGDLVTASAQNGSPTITSLGGTFSYSGTGHHVMNQALDLITRQIGSAAL